MIIKVRKIIQDSLVKTGNEIVGKTFGKIFIIPGINKVAVIVKVFVTSVCLMSHFNITLCGYAKSHQWILTICNKAERENCGIRLSHLSDSGIDLRIPSFFVTDIEFYSLLNKLHNRNPLSGESSLFEINLRSFHLLHNFFIIFQILILMSCKLTVRTLGYIRQLTSNACYVMIYLINFVVLI